ncbi:selenocysteine-specific translation elongation factor [Bacillus sp. FJAT-49736]|uniref:selenocysteine-specific translation elongation factor n=1 Tax=Bacillus sp. FJAT-49736 TaxID=2833582 RepID=UPI001BC9E752|nr:selenocysteine-specific translation elongation factor [Bacillus sp. FJAT-49736]MBS4172641.1 selenocysteine-specific translation elongation factor [Bacillus sp. FJAT-49736]
MKKRYFTVGMAGHIDHGKTALTKALTNVDTDRLKEEKERQISIELGFAPLYDDDKTQVSIIDVPGHEKFIRKMIAGVAGIDFVILVISADEGVMPQTIEHAEILSFLKIRDGIIALTKTDKVDKDVLALAMMDIRESLKGTMFEKLPILPVSSITKHGCEELKSTILERLAVQPERFSDGDFRMPIDQVFTLKGQGTIVRGTIYEGNVKEGDTLLLHPNDQNVKVRQIQVHHHRVKNAYSGQRTALNISGIPFHEIKRGDTLVSTKGLNTTNTLDVNIHVVQNLKHMIKQRMPINCYIGTTEVTGKIVFFDRNEVMKENNEILCQLRLDAPIVAKRGDRFIIRRPSPYETIGGGWVIDPYGKRYKFGMETIQYLQQKSSGSLSERLFSFIQETKAKEKSQILYDLSIKVQELEKIINHEDWILYDNQFITHISIVNNLIKEIEEKLISFHTDFPLQIGMNKAELLQYLQIIYPIHLMEYCLTKGYEESKWIFDGPYILMKNFRRHIPERWNKPVAKLLALVKKDDWQVDSLFHYMDNLSIENKVWKEITGYLVEQGSIVPLTETLYWHKETFLYYAEKLKNNTRSSFEMQEAKNILGFSRKYLVPFLETLDREKVTIRNGNGRTWN